MKDTYQWDAWSVLNVASGIIAARTGVSPLSAIGIGLALDLIDRRQRAHAVTNLAVYFAAYGVGLTSHALTQTAPRS